MNLGEKLETIERKLERIERKLETIERKLDPIERKNETIRDIQKKYSGYTSEELTEIFKKQVGPL
jgi:Skp family chaperone for outer membrane proteins